MALDQVPNACKEVRYKIMGNIANAFVRLGQYQDAIQSFEAIMEGNADHEIAFNLLVAYYALGDKEKMKRTLARIIAIPGYQPVRNTA